MWRVATPQRRGISQAIWLLARGHTVHKPRRDGDRRATDRTIADALQRRRTEALGDLRRGNGASVTILKPELLAKLRKRLGEPPQASRS